MYILVSRLQWYRFQQDIRYLTCSPKDRSLSTCKPDFLFEEVECASKTLECSQFLIELYLFALPFLLSSPPAVVKPWMPFRI